MQTNRPLGNRYEDKTLAWDGNFTKYSWMWRGRYPTDDHQEDEKKAVKAVDVRQRVDNLINPKPIKALSEIGHVTPTPEFIKVQKVEQKYPNGQSQRELTIHFYKNGPNLFHGEFKEWHPNGTLWKQGTLR